jgi:hypothetical protein
METTRRKTRGNRNPISFRRIPGENSGRDAFSSGSRSVKCMAGRL